MNWVLKMMGFKNHDSSINRALLKHEKNNVLSFADKLFYWWFFHT